MRFLIRADASAETGSGHVMRTLALAQGLRRHSHTISFLHSCPPLLRARLSTEGFPSINLDAAPGSAGDAAITIQRAQEVNAEWVIADGYEFDTMYQRSIQNAGLRLLLVDDNGDADGYPADIVLNQSLHASPLVYGSWYDSHRYLLGGRFALLREEFSEWVGWRRPVAEPPRRMLVTLGGMPSSAWISRLLPELSGAGLDVVVAGGIDSDLRRRLEPSTAIEFLGHVDNIADVIVRSDIGLTAGGGATREFLFLGLPFAVVDVAENQVIQSQFLADQSLALRLGHIDALAGPDLLRAVRSLTDNRSERRRMSRSGQETVDGYGVDRVVARLTS